MTVRFVRSRTLMWGPLTLPAWLEKRIFFPSGEKDGPKQSPVQIAMGEPTFFFATSTVLMMRAIPLLSEGRGPQYTIFWLSREKDAPLPWAGPTVKGRTLPPSGSACCTIRYPSRKYEKYCKLGCQAAAPEGILLLVSFFRFTPSGLIT